MSPLNSPVVTLVGHFFKHALSRPMHWVVFVLLPVATMLAMQLLLDFPATGVLIFTITLQAGVIASLSLREKEIGIYHRILAAPVSPTIYTIGLFLGVFFVLVLEICIVLTVTAFVTTGTSLDLAESFLVTLIYTATAAAYGIMLTSFASTHTQGTVLTNVTVIFMSMISGCFWPLSIMPEYMQNIARILPQTWANLAIDQLSSGASAASVTTHLLVLPLYAVVFLLIFGLRRKFS